MPRSALFCLSLASASLLAGCSYTSQPLQNLDSVAAGAHIRGAAHGGQQPVVGAHVYLLAADTSGYGNASLSLLDPAVTGLSDSLGAYVLTGQNGEFGVGGAYTCTPNQQLYLYVQGGDPGAGVNSASGFMAVLGNCPAAGNLAATVPYVSVNEASTVAAAYALAGFATDATHVSAPNNPRALLGLAHAFATAANLVAIDTGAVLPTTPAGNGAVPVTKLNSLADILSSCINTSGPSSSQCSHLFDHAKSNGSNGITATDTATAAINIAHNPAANVTGLFALQPPTGAAFLPALVSPPTDWTLTVAYTGAGLSASAAEQAVTSNVNNLAIDADGNVWHANYSANTLTKLGPLGEPLSGSTGFTAGGFNGPANVAVDLNGNIWTGNNADTTVSAILPDGTALSGSPFTTGSTGAPANLAVDGTGSVWIANGDATMSKLNGSGMPEAGSPFQTNTLSGPTGIAVLSSGDVWVNNATSGSVAVYTSTGAQGSTTQFATLSVSAPAGLAFNAAGDGWIADSTTLTSVLSSGAGVQSASLPASASPSSVAVDGAGNLWATDTGNNTLLQLDNSGNLLSGTVGFRQGSANVPQSLAVDGSGNVWFSSANQSAIYELIGAAAPVVTPLALAVATNTLGARP